jgi:YHS domain-containing protein
MTPTGVTKVVSLTILASLGLANVAAEPMMLTDDQINNTLAGNTLSEGADWAEYYWPNGVIARKAYRGQWSVKDGLVCFDYSGTSYDGCYRMSVEGNEVRLYSEQGKLRRTTQLLKGNPKNLVPAHGGGTVNKTFIDGIAIQGYDPVAYFTEGRPMKGSAEFARKWLGATWHFANAGHRDAFAAQPEKYMPQFGGYCAAAMARGFVKSFDPEAWRIVDGKLYVYASKKGRDMDKENIPASIAKGNANWRTIKTGLSQ